MTDLIICSAGIDVAKDKLDKGLFPGGQHVTVAYTDEGLAALDRFVAEHNVARIGFEASGGYEWRLLAHLRNGSVAAARFQPGQIKAFGKSRLQRAKNDRLDAGKLARLARFEPALLHPIRHRGEQAQLDLVVLRGRERLLTVP